QRALRSQLRSELEQLSPRQRRLLRDERRQLLIEKIDRFRALPKTEQVAFLDREIDRLIALRREERSAGSAATTGSPAGAPRPSADQRDGALKQQPDATTPEQRAKLGDYGKQMLDRANARGLIGADFPGTLQSVLVFY